MKSAVDSLAMIERVEAVAEAARTEAAPTRTMPIINAPAVLAVRRRLRVTLPRASRPSGLTAATNPAASTFKVRATITGASTSTPTTRAAAPGPSIVGPCGVGRAIALITAVAPAPMSRAPPSALRRRDRPPVTTVSCIACTGGVRAACRPGSTAAAALTSVPTAREVMIVLASRGMLPDRSRPNRRKAIRSSETSPIPASSPSAEPARPTTVAWMRIEANTCGGEAPTARNRANSRIRCRTDMEKVLEMMNAATNREMPAKMSMKVCMKPRASSMLAAVSARAVSPVTTSAVAAAVVLSIGAMRRTRAVWLTPSSAYTAMVVTLPSAAKAAIAVGTST